MPTGAAAVRQPRLIAAAAVTLLYMRNPKTANILKNELWSWILKAKSDATFAAVAELFGISETELNYEWQFLRRLPAHGFVD